MQTKNTLTFYSTTNSKHTMTNSKHTKERFISLFVTILSLTICHAQNMPEQLAQYRDICVQAKNAYWAHDVEALSTSITQLDNIPTEPISISIQEGCEVDNTDFHFTAEWLDNQLCAWLDTTYQVHHMHRGGDVLTEHVKVKANSTASVSFSGMRKMSLIVIAEDDTNIQIKVEQDACNHQYESTQNARNGCQEHCWYADTKDNENIILSITNPANHDVVCLIVSD